MLGKTALLLACSIGVASAAQVPDDVQKAISSDYALGCTAVLSPTEKNLDALFALYAPDFVNTDVKGKQLKREQIVTSLKQQLAAFHGTDCTNNFDSITAPDPNTIIVVNDSKILGDVDAPDGRHDLDFSGKSEDTWKNENGTWLETQSTDLSTVVKIDGSVVQTQNR